MKAIRNNPLVSATAELEAALDDKEHDGSRAAHRRVCKAMSAVCSAYIKGRKSGASGPFPVLAAELWELQLQRILGGRLSPMMNALVRRLGPRNRSFEETSDIEFAVMYIQAVKKGLITDHKPILKIAELYGVSRATAQSWHREEKRDLLSTFDVDAKFLTDLTAAIERCGKRYRSITGRV